MITTLTDKAIGVQVGKDHFDFRFELSEYLEEGKWILVYKTPFIWEKYGKEMWNWKIKFDEMPLILGLGKDLTEDQWREVVETVDYDLPPSPGNDFQGDWATAWRDYNSNVETGRSEYPYVATALESGLS